MAILTILNEQGVVYASLLTSGVAVLKYTKGVCHVAHRNVVDRHYNNHFGG